MRKYRRPPNEIIEALEGAQTFLRHAGGEHVGIVLADDGAGLAAGAGAQEGFLQQYDLADFAPRQRVGDAGADHAAADDQDVAGLRHGDKKTLEQEATERTENIETIFLFCSLCCLLFLVFLLCVICVFVVNSLFVLQVSGFSERETASDFALVIAITSR